MRSLRDSAPTRKSNSGANSVFPVAAAEIASRNRILQAGLLKIVIFKAEASVSVEDVAELSVIRLQKKGNNLKHFPS